MTSKNVNKKPKKKNEKIAEDSGKLTCLMKPQIFSKIDSYFNEDEKKEIRSVLKLADTDEIPVILGATILNKLCVIKEAVSIGYSVNEKDSFHNSSLMWAVRYKFLDIVQYLLYERADPTAKNDDNENAIIVALDHNLWDEQSFTNFYFNLKKYELISRKFFEENAEDFLHLTVKREWEVFLSILINERVNISINIDISNANGVTALMVACGKNNFNLASALLNAGACSLKEDHNGSMAICYAMLGAFKSDSPSFEIVEKLLNDVKKFLSFKEYIKKRLEQLNGMAENDTIFEELSEIIKNVIHYIVQHTPSGLKILLECNIMQQLYKAIKMSAGNNHKIDLFLVLVLELLFFNEQSDSFNAEIQILLLGKFSSSLLPNTCLDLLKNSDDKSISRMSFFVLILACTCNEFGQKWIIENYEHIVPFYKINFKDPLNFINYDFGDDRRMKVIKKKLKKIKRLINKIESSKPGTPRILFSKEERNFGSKNEKKQDAFINCSKKTRRRSKALKVKMTKMKSAELTQRLNNLGSKKVIENQKSAQKLQEKKTEKNLKNNTQSLDQVSDLPCNYEEGDNPISASLMHFLQNTDQIGVLDEEIKPKTSSGSRTPRWKSQILTMSFEDSNSILNRIRFDRNKVTEAFGNMKDTAVGGKPMEKLEYSLNTITDYLHQLLEYIVEQYQKNWEKDKASNTNSLFEECSKLIGDNSETCKSNRDLEKLCIANLEKHFANLIGEIRNSATKNILLCYNNVCQLEHTLLTFKIREKPLYADLASCENVKMKYMLPRREIIESEGDFIDKYVEDVLNDKFPPRDDIVIQVYQDPSAKHVKLEETQSELFNRELEEFGKSNSKHVDKQKAFVDKQKTLDDAYHLIDSIMGTCDSDEEKDANRKNQVYTRIWYAKTKQNNDNLMGNCSQDVYSFQPMIFNSWEDVSDDIKQVADNTDIDDIEDLY